MEQPQDTDAKRSVLEKMLRTHTATAPNLPAASDEQSPRICPSALELLLRHG